MTDRINELTNEYVLRQTLFMCSVKKKMSRLKYITQTLSH